jgi:hypothetical protein
MLMMSVSGALRAHHSVAVFYEVEASSEIQGTITNLRWINPHIQFTLESVNANGEPETWAVEAGSVNSLERNGIRREQLEVGSEVTVVGRPSRLGRAAMYAASISVPGGETVVMQGVFAEQQAAAAGLLADSAAASEDASIFRVWLRGRSFGDPVNDLPFGFDLPYTAEAVAARESYDPLTDDTALECIPQGMPGIMDNPFPIEFSEQGDDIVLRLEEWDTVRTIRMTPGADPAGQPATPLGYSVGRWESDTLVVATTRIDWPFFDDVGTPQSAEVETLERFWLNDDRTRLNYEITVTDPVTFSEPVTLDGYWAWAPGQEIKPFNCTL